MHKLQVVLAAFAALVMGFVFAAAPASAAVSFHFDSLSFNDGFTASGTLTCAQALDANNSCIVTGITGTVTKTNVNGGLALPIIGLSFYNLPDQRIFYFANDEHYPRHGDLTLAGLSFTTSSAAFPDGAAYNIFSRGIGPQGSPRISETNETQVNGGIGKLGAIAIFELSPAAVPEPASWALLIAGFGIIGSMLRCRSSTLSLA